MAFLATVHLKLPGEAWQTMVEIRRDQVACSSRNRRALVGFREPHYKLSYKRKEVSVQEVVRWWFDA